MRAGRPTVAQHFVLQGNWERRGTHCVPMSLGIGERRNNATESWFGKVDVK